jgi:hypothetical protein
MIVCDSRRTSLEDHPYLDESSGLFPDIEFF